MNHLSNEVYGGTRLMALVIVLVAVVAAIFLGGFIVMLSLGFIYGEFGLLAPLGYWSSVVGYILLASLVGLVTARKSD